MSKWVAPLFLSMMMALPAGFATPAMAESGLAAFFLAGQPRVQGGKYRSNKSPIPRKNVRFDPSIEPGTIVIETSKRRLYLTKENGKAIEYAVGVGREGFEWYGANKISRTAEWPGCTPPAVMRARVKREEGRILPAYVPGGPDNPLGARAMYIGSSIYRIHGTNQPWTIGQAMSSGCIRMANDDVTHLYNQVGIGTKVIVRR